MFSYYSPVMVNPVIEEYICNKCSGKTIKKKSGLGDDFMFYFWFGVIHALFLATIVITEYFSN